MQIQSIGVLSFRSNKDKEPKLILRTAKDVQNWMKSKDPILVYDDKIDYELPKNQYKTKKALKPYNQRKRATSFDNATLDNATLTLFNDIVNKTEILKKEMKYINTYDLQRCMKFGLNKHVARRIQKNGIIVKNPENQDLWATMIVGNDKNDDCKLNITDNANNTSRSYLISNGSVAYLPNSKKFSNFPEFLNKAKLEEIKGLLNEDLIWVKKSFVEAIEYVRNNQRIQGLIKKRKLVVK